jgi:very-short-patch-repair endonuclease
MLAKYLQTIPLGKVSTIICQDVSETLATLELSESEADDNVKIVALAWPQLPDVKTLINDAVTALARVALAIWPAWYAHEISCKADSERPLETAISNFQAITVLAKSRQPLSLAWFKAAVTCCHSDTPPCPKGFPNEIQASQLALAIDPANLIIVLGIEESNPDENTLRGFAKMAEWFSSKTKARITVLIPEGLSDNRALDSILYKALRLTEPKETRPGKWAKSESKHLIWPLLGRPHPFSPGEQALAKWLAKDKELAGLFSFNQRVKTIKNSHYIVDLLWPEAKLVVEIDGFKFHSNKYAFSRDRNKDYELTISGFTVLRIPHDEVMQDIFLAIEKIRDVVTFCRNTTLKCKRGKNES